MIDPEFATTVIARLGTTGDSARPQGHRPAAPATAVRV